ncbi:MAG: hypothetical protein R3A47_02470 [Polyangiales bacterium]
MALAQSDEAAFYARADDPSAVLYNPAALSRISGVQLMAGANLTFFKGCIDRLNPANPTGSQDDPSEAQYPEVCNGQRMSPVPNISLAWRVNKDIGIGLGVFAPSAFLGMSWGSTKDDSTYGTIENPDGSGGRIPVPTRYILNEDKVVVVFPTLAVGVRPLKWLAFGASFAAGVMSAEFTQTVRLGAPGENASGDVRTDLKVHDWFIPRVQASMLLMPHPNVDITFGVRIEDSIKASGDVHGVTALLGDSAPLDGTAKFNVPRPLWANFGIRYANRIAPEPEDPAEASKLSGRVEDPMSNERWDIEADVVYERNRVVDSLVTTVSDLGPNPLTGSNINTTISLPHGWDDQWSIRAGSDWNIKPGNLRLV